LKETPLGGLYVFIEFLYQVGFHTHFDRCFKKLRKVRQSSPFQNDALLAGMIISDGERLHDIGRLTHDDTIEELFDIPAAPKDATLRDDLLLIDK